MEIFIPKETSLPDLLESSATNLDDYYFMPFWLEKLSNGDYKLHHLDNVPEELKLKIETIRNNV